MLISKRRRQAVVADVTSNILTAVRGIFALLIPAILLGFLWSGGALNGGEYTLWGLVLSICVHVVYVSGPTQLFKHDRVREIVFNFEWLVLLAGVVLKLLGVVRSPDISILAVFLALLAVMHIARRSLMKSRRDFLPPK